MVESNHTENSRFETRNITIRIEDQRLSLTIPRTEVAEQKIRRAADQVNSVLEKYRLAFPEAKKEDLMTYVALHIANNAQSKELEMDNLKLSDRLEKMVKQLDQLV